MSVNHLSEYYGAALGVSEENATSTLPDVISPAILIPRLFTFQSYHDSTLLEKAILSQPKNVTIVPSTVKVDQTPGYAIGLAPYSQTPVAIEFLTGTKSGSATLVLKPGQIIRPQGGSTFLGFRWGLPFGWLGGGLATIVVFTTKDSHVRWTEGTEVIFHRVRIPVLQPADLTAAGANNNARKNWPFRFPWTQALFGTNSINQNGSPILSISNPTRTLMVLRGASTLGAGATMRMIFQATNDVGLNAAGAVVNTNPIFEDVTWPVWTSLGTSGNLATQNPFLMRTGGVPRLAADDGGLALLDVSGTAALTGLFVDFVRYGML